MSLCRQSIVDEIERTRVSPSRRHAARRRPRFGRGPVRVPAPVEVPRGLSDDLKLFLTTFAGGFIFVSRREGEITEIAGDLALAQIRDCPAPVHETTIVQDQDVAAFPSQGISDRLSGVSDGVEPFFRFRAGAGRFGHERHVTPGHLYPW